MLAAPPTFLFLPIRFPLLSFTPLCFLLFLFALCLTLLRLTLVGFALLLLNLDETLTKE